MVITFASWWPWLLLPALPCGWWLAARGRRAMGRRRFVVVHCLRSLAVIAVIAALAGPSVPRETDALSVVYALDVSRSVAPESVSAALAWIRESVARHRPAQARYVVFADHAELLSRLEDIEAVYVGGTQDDSAPAVDQRATDLERGVAASMVGFRPGHAKRLVLITDGKQTQGDVWRQLQRLRDERVRVFAMPALTRFTASAWIDGIEFPAGIRAQAPLTARVRVTATAAMRASLWVRAGTAPRQHRSAGLDTGQNDVTVDLQFLRPGENTVQVTLTTPDGRTDSSTSSVWVGPRVRLLIVEGGRTGGRYLTDTLSAHGIDVRTFSPGQLAQDPAGALEQADAVLLSDVNAEMLGEDVYRSLQAFVRDRGGGLIFVAGENTYGKGGFSESPLEQMLPVTFEARRKRNELDLVLLLDRSHSMTGERLELAKTAALATLDLMEPQHRLAVVAFDSKPHDVLPLTRVGNKRRAEDAIGTIATGGRTDVYAALQRAHELLRDSESKTRHVILLTDGQSAPPPRGRSVAKPSPTTGIRSTLESQLRGMGYSAEHIRRLLNEDRPERTVDATGGFEEMASEIAASGITLSTVAIGDEPDLALLASLAAHGNGKAYVARRDSEIPGLFVTEARRLLGEALVEEPFRPTVAGAAEILTGVDFKTGPELKGFVTTKPKRFSDVLLEAGEKAPLLVETRYGLGKTVAFLSDAKNRWAKDWLAWPGYGRFWSQVVRDAARVVADEGLAWSVVRREGLGLVTLTAFAQDGSFRNELWPKVRVHAPDGGSSIVLLRQSAPGTYAAAVPLQPGALAPYRFELLPGPGLSPQDLARLGARTLHYADGDEFRPRLADLPLLKSLSERTGGKFAATEAEIFAPSSDGGTVDVALWPMLAAVALLLVLLEIAARRVPWRILDGTGQRLQ